jgi:thiamine transport system substrate-binding protein
LIKFLTESTFQDTVAENMWVYPANPEAEIPASWQQFGPLAAQPWTLDPAAIAAGRDGWIKQWTEVATG